jgi:hypothetical protein
VVVTIRATIIPKYDTLLRRTPVVGIETVYRPADPGFECRQRQEIFMFCKPSRRLWGPPGLLFNG